MFTLNLQATNNINPLENESLFFFFVFFGRRVSCHARSLGDARGSQLRLAPSHL